MVLFQFNLVFLIYFQINYTYFFYENLDFLQKVCGLVYCFGDNSYNQLGRRIPNDGPLKCSRPERTKFSSGVKIKKVSCGAFHTAAVSGSFFMRVDLYLSFRSIYISPGISIVYI